MNILLLEVASKKLLKGKLLPAEFKDMRTITDGWNFNWRRHFRLPGSRTFKIVTGAHPEKIEGLMIFQLQHNEEP